MTKIQPSKPVIRQTDVFDRTDPLIVELHPKHLVIRRKGDRASFDIDYQSLAVWLRKLDARRYAQAARG